MGEILYGYAFNLSSVFELDHCKLIYLLEDLKKY